MSNNDPDEIGSIPGSVAGSGHWALIARYGGKHGRRIAMAASVLQTARPIYLRIKGKMNERNTYTITVLGTDDIYGDLHTWVLSLLPEESRRALIAVTGEDLMRTGTTRLKWSGSPEALIDPDVEEASPAVANVALRYDGNRVQEVDLEGHTVTVQITRESMQGSDGKSINVSDQYRRYFERIVFTTTTAEGRDAVVRRIDDLVEAKKDEPGPPPLVMPSRWNGGWDFRSDLPPRTLDSIVLKRGQLERMVDTLRAFFDGEDDYVRISQPWHLGMLLHGPPGTGKTSLAKALANHFGMPIYYLPFGDLKEDSELMNLVSSVKPRSMLLLEDVDVYHAATQRDDVDGRTTLSAMLNALDGIWTPHGLITVMTTNHREKLDDALIRAGRVDIDEELTNLDADQALRLMEWFYRRPFEMASYGQSVPMVRWKDDDGQLMEACWYHEWSHVSPADMIGAMNKNRDDPGRMLRGQPNG